MGHDTRDREKIRDRTRPNTGAFDYRLRLRGATEADRPVSFLVVGDSGAGGGEVRPKYNVADAMAAEAGVDLALHLGDLVYISGSREGYRNRFIRVFKDWIVDPDRAEWDGLVFSRPFLPIYGNHDYYDYGDLAGPLLGATLGRLIGRLEHELGSGSGNGTVFEEVFVNRDEAAVRDGALEYRPAEATRLPNRYYWFTYGGCAFYALDSNTLDATGPVLGDERRHWERRLAVARATLAAEDARAEAVRDEIDRGDAEALRDLLHDLADARKAVDALENRLAQEREDFDEAQLAWLERVLEHPDAEGKWKVAYLHHPFYSSDESHTGDPESEGVRANLSRVLADHGVHLVLSGHAHCFEWVRRRVRDPLSPTPDETTCYIVSGGGGQGLRTSVLDEAGDDGLAPTLLAERRADRARFRGLADSLAYVGRLGDEEIHHYLRVDVAADALTVTPVGVTTFGATAIRDRPMRVQVFGGGGTPPEVKRLEAITVTRDRPPRGQFRPL